MAITKMLQLHTIFSLNQTKLATWSARVKSLGVMQKITVHQLSRRTPRAHRQVLSEGKAGRWRREGAGRGDRPRAGRAAA